MYGLVCTSEWTGTPHDPIPARINILARTLPTPASPMQGCCTQLVLISLVSPYFPRVEYWERVIHRYVKKPFQTCPIKNLQNRDSDTARHPRSCSTCTNTFFTPGLGTYIGYSVYILSVSTYLPLCAFDERRKKKRTKVPTFSE